MEADVAVTPGLDFDKGRGHRTLRLSYARGTAEIEKGVARLTRFFAGMADGGNAALGAGRVIC
jgi:aspartate/methionine/tyrosine aminotransferase